MPNRNIRILIADSQLLIREGLKALLSNQSNMEIVGEVGQSTDLQTRLKQDAPDVVIIDYNLPGAFSTEDVQMIKALSPQTQVLVISSDLEKDSVIQALQYGAKSFLTKQCDEVEILGAVRATANAEKYFCNKVLDIILERELNPETITEPCDPVHLTERELEIVSLMTQGKNAQEIASNLSLSVHTIYTHRKNIRKKLGVTSAANVILYAIKTGLG